MAKGSKWDTIDWSKRKSDEDKESKWDKIDWNKDRSEIEKIEEYKYENFKDNLMNGSELKEEMKFLKIMKKSLMKILLKIIKRKSIIMMMI